MLLELKNHGDIFYFIYLSILQKKLFKTG